MKRFALIPALVFLLTAGAMAQKTAWNIDNSHTTIGFNVTHLVISEVDGKFNKYDGKIHTNGDNFENASVELTVDIASIYTGNEKRDGHLKSDDFFNAEKYPQMTFKSTSMKKTGKNTYDLKGKLTIRDVTKDVVLKVKHNGTVKDPWGNTVAGFKISGTLNRFDYKLKWNTLMEAGGAVVGEDIELDIDLELRKKA
ncbi:MAG: polyisoprenoid-binding protein [Ignavibacteria bacterium]|nr:MAG: polyisoprenoid-binding protein [Ignavibacteria bacterium]